MSHIPAAAMKHAGPHLDAANEAAAPPPARSGTVRSDASLGVGGWSLLALGGTVAVGLIAAVAGPAVRKLRQGPAAATSKRKRAKPRKSAQA